MPDTPTEVLAAAAARLRALADDDLSPSFQWDDERAVLLDSNGDHVTAETTSPEGRWMAALGPQIAEPLARLMDREGREAHFNQVMCGDSQVGREFMADQYGALMEIARSILGRTVAPTVTARPEPDYEYRVLERRRYLRTEHDYAVEAGKVEPGWSEWSDWSPLITGRGQGRPFRKLGSAKGVITSQRSSQHIEHEYRIQRRPITTEWEEMPDAA
jgi:hypothetical protein